MHGIVVGSFTVSKRREPAYCVSHGSYIFRFRRDDLDRPQSRGEQHHTPSSLRETVLGAIYHASIDMVSLVHQRVCEIVENGMLGDSGDVLHRHYLGPRFFDEAVELVKESPARTAQNIISLRLCRKGLARSAARENPDFALAVQSVQLCARDLADVFFYEFRGIVEFEGVTTALFNVDTSDDINSLFL